MRIDAATIVMKSRTDKLLRWRTISFTEKGLGCIRGPIRAIVTLLIPLQKD